MRYMVLPKKKLFADVFFLLYLGPIYVLKAWGEFGWTGMRKTRPKIQIVNNKQKKRNLRYVFVFDRRGGGSEQT